MTDTSVTAIAPQPPLIVLRQKLEDRRKELRHALPSDIDPADFIRAVTTSAQLNPDLQACSFQSLWLAALRACRDGLLPDGREGAIVPYKSQAQWIPMTYGLIKRFRQSGECRWITADVVREGEKFEHWIDQTGEHFLHVAGDDDTLPIIKVYGAALTKDGAFSCAVLSMNEINKIKNESRATRDDSPWKKWPTEMMKKTALRRLAKMLPAGRLIADEDETPIEAPPLAPPMPLPPRPASAADALQAFASDVADATGGSGGGELSGLFPDGAAAVENDALLTAHKRGREARAAGHNRRAMPGEYRALDRIREQQAWTAGYEAQESEGSGG